MTVTSVYVSKNDLDQRGGLSTELVKNVFPHLQHFLIKLNHRSYQITES